MGEGEWALSGVVVGAALTGFFSYALQDRQFDHNKEMFLLSNKSKESVKSILEEMLNHRTHTDRSFEALRKPIGGYSDEEIRQFLHELEAKKAIRDDGTEWWYLLSRRDERNAKRAERNA